MCGKQRGKNQNKSIPLFFVYKRNRGISKIGKNIQRLLGGLPSTKGAKIEKKTKKKKKRDLRI